MSLSSASTLAEVKAAYEDNCDYDLGGGVAKGRDFVQAGRILLRRMAEEVQHGDEKVVDDYRKIEAEVNRAVRWLETNDRSMVTAAGAGSVRFFGLDNFRG